VRGILELLGGFHGAEPRACGGVDVLLPLLAVLVVLEEVHVMTGRLTLAAARAAEDSILVLLSFLTTRNRSWPERTHNRRRRTPLR